MGIRKSSILFVLLVLFLTGCTRLAIPENVEFVRITEDHSKLECKDGDVIPPLIIEGDYVTVRGCKITNPNFKTGIRVYGNHAIIEDNEIYGLAEDCMWIWGEGNVIRGNRCHDIHDDRNWPTIDQHVDCFMTWDWEPMPGVKPATNLLIEGNVCELDRPHGSNQFFIMTNEDPDRTPRNITFIDNTWICHDTGYCPISFFTANPLDIFVVDNYFSCPRGCSETMWLEGPVTAVTSGNTTNNYSGEARKLAGASTVEDVRYCIEMKTSVRSAPTLWSHKMFSLYPGDEVDILYITPAVDLVGIMRYPAEFACARFGSQELCFATKFLDKTYAKKCYN